MKVLNVFVCSIRSQNSKIENLQEVEKKLLNLSSFVKVSPMTSAKSKIIQKKSSINFGLKKRLSRSVNEKEQSKLRNIMEISNKSQLISSDSKFQW